MESDKVCVIMVNYNTTELIPEVLRCINEDKIDVSILIVDNGSTKESYNDLLKIKDERVHVIRIEENRGIGGGNNYGIQYVADHFKDVKYIFLLNTDAYCSPGILYELKSILVENPNAACVSPKINMKNGALWYGGSRINYKKGVVTTSIHINPENKKKFYEIDVYNGCAVLFDLKKMLEAGLWNDKLFMYFEEADHCLRLFKLGYKILYAPDYLVIHDVSYTTRKVSFLKTYYMTRNKFVLFNKTMNLSSKVYYLVHEFAYHLKYKRVKNAVYLLKGYLDFKKGKYGKLELSNR